MGNDLLDKILDIQRREQLSDAGMARRLVVSRGLWQQARSGKRPLGKKVIDGAVCAWPELWPHVIADTHQRTAARIRARGQAPQGAHRVGDRRAALP